MEGLCRILGLGMWRYLVSLVPAVEQAGRCSRGRLGFFSTLHNQYQPPVLGCTSGLSDMSVPGPSTVPSLAVPSVYWQLPHHLNPDLSSRPARLLQPIGRSACSAYRLTSSAYRPLRQLTSRGPLPRPLLSPLSTPLSNPSTRRPNPTKSSNSRYRRRPPITR